MRPSEWFGVGVRVLGVWRAVVAVEDLATILDIRLGYFVPQRTAFASYSIHCAVDVVIALYLLLGTRHLTTLIYGREEAGFEVLSSKSVIDENRPGDQG
jgi:hypothetical protein